MDNYKNLYRNITAYKKKFMLNRLLKGMLFFFSGVIVLFLLLAFLEYLLRFDSITRALLFFAACFSILAGAIKWLIIPLYQYLFPDKFISDETASREIGQQLDGVGDKLINFLQLTRLKTEFAELGSHHRYDQLSGFDFSKAISLEENKQFFIRYFIGPLALMLLISLIAPSIITESTQRIIGYNKTYVPAAPFSISIKNENLNAYYNEDFILNLNLKGEKLPDLVYLNYNQRKIALTKISESEFQYTFQKVNKDIDFNLEAAGFSFGPYTLKNIFRPEILTYQASIRYPKYLNKSNEKIENLSSVTVPEGSKIEWKFRINNSRESQLVQNENIKTYNSDNKELNLVFDTTFLETSKFKIRLKNEHESQFTESEYTVNVIKDAFPNINLNYSLDTSFFNFVLIDGIIRDDYGFSNLKLYYKYESDKNYQSVDLSFNKNQINQNYYKQLFLDSVKNHLGESLLLFAQVWDNDGVNGRKSSKTKTVQVQLPSESDISKQLDNNDEEISKQLDNALTKAEEQKELLKKTKDKLKSKTELTWEDKKELENLIKSQKELEKEIDKLNEKLKENSFKKEEFSESSKKIMEKSKELEELMNEVMDEELKSMYEELEKLLEENKMEDINEQLKDMEYSNEQLENELDRQLELFKQLKFEQKLQEAINDLNKLSEKQEKLAEQTENKEKGAEELQKKQEELNKEFQDVKDKLAKAEEMNKDLESPNSFDEQKEQQENIEQEQQESSEQLDKKQNKKASDSQKKASEQMKSMAQKLQQQQQAMQMEMLTEDMNALRQLLNNLVTLSFEQEEVMKSFRTIARRDPSYVELSQRQLKLEDDSKIIEDSLLALSKRVVQIKNIVLEELSNMKQNMSDASGYIKQREAPKAAVKQQYAMTAINNLALLLSQVLDQMQQEMAQQMQGDQMCNKPKKGGNKPSLGQMQEQLNQQMQQLKEGGAKGKQLSEQLGKMAAQQERIRRALKEMEQAGDGNKPGTKLSEEIKKLEKMMEENEKNLVNKDLERINKQRQAELLTKLLEAEKASKEQNQDKKREAVTAKQKIRTTPPQVEEYLKQKEKEIELLRTIPMELNPYYKKRVNNYFSTIN